MKRDGAAAEYRSGLGNTAASTAASARVSRAAGSWKNRCAAASAP